MAEENKNAAAGNKEKIQQLEADLKTAFKEEHFEDVKKLADELGKLDSGNHLAERLLEKVKKAEAAKLKEANADKIKDLEKDLKAAFKDGRIPDLNKTYDDLIALDPENKVAKKIEKQINKAKEALKSQVKKEKVKILTAELKELTKKEDWDSAAKKANELLSVDEKNRTAMKAIKKAAKAKGVEPETLITVSKPAEAGKKPEKSKSAEPAKSTPSKSEEPKHAPDSDPVKEEKKSGFFSRLFKKKEKKADEEAKPDLSKAEKKEGAPKAESPIKAESKEEDKKAEAKPALGKDEEKKSGMFANLFKKKAEAPIKSEKVKMEEGKSEAKAEVKKTEVKPAEITKEDKEKIKKLEEDLKLASKEGREADVKTAMEEIKKLDLENKLVQKTQTKIDKEKAKLDAQAKKEKLKALEGELKELLKSEQWDKAVKKSNELLEVEWNFSAAIKALKKVAKDKGVDHTTLITVSEPKVEKKPGLFARLFKKKPALSEAEREEQAPEEAKKEAVKPAVESPIKPVETKAPTVTPAAPAPAKPATSATAAAPEIKPVPAAKPGEVKPVTPPVKPITPVAAQPAVAPSGAQPAIKPITPAVKPSGTPAATPAPIKPAVTPSGAQPATPSAIKPAEKAGPATEKKPDEAPAAEEGAKKGNIFTSLFGKKAAAPAEAKEGEAEKPTESIIDTIVAKTEQTKVDKKKEKKKEVGTGVGFLKFSTAFLEFSVAFILISAGFFYVQNMDSENQVLSIVGIEDTNASLLLKAANTAEEKGKKEGKLNKDIKKYKEGYENEHKETIETIIDNRMDWYDLIQKLSEVTESVYEKNVLSQYVQYNNYSYNVENGQLTVSATLSDPLGKNLTKLAELEEAFRNYPKDPDDPTDERKPYFYGLKEFSSYSKSFDKSTGRYKSSFSLAVSTKEPKKKK